MFQTNFFCLGFLCKNSVVMHSVLRVSVLPQFLGLAALRSISMSKFCSCSTLSFDKISLNKLAPGMHKISVETLYFSLHRNSLLIRTASLFFWGTALPPGSKQVALIQAVNYCALTTGVSTGPSLGQQRLLPGFYQNWNSGKRFTLSLVRGWELQVSRQEQLCLTKWIWDEERSWDERWRHLGGGQVPGARCLVRDASLPYFSLIGWANKFPFCPTPWNPNSWHPSIFLLIYIDHPIHLKTLSNLIPHSFINIKSFPKLWLQWSWSFSLSTTGSIYWESTMCPSSKNTVMTKFSNEHN